MELCKRSSGKQKSYPMFLKPLCPVHSGKFGLFFLRCPICSPLYIYDLRRSAFSYHLLVLSSIVVGVFLLYNICQVAVLRPLNEGFPLISVEAKGSKAYPKLCLLVDKKMHESCMLQVWGFLCFVCLFIFLFSII